MRTGQTVVRDRLRWGLVCALVAACLPLVGQAQSTTAAGVWKTGLHTFYRGHVAAVTLTETGTPTVPSTATLVLYDQADQVIGSANGEVRRGAPLRLEARIPLTVRRTLVRAEVVLVSTKGGGSQPVAVYEDLNPALGLTIGIGVCGGDVDAGGGQFQCPGIGGLVPDVPAPGAK